MSDIREFSKSLQELIRENDAMKREIALYKNQLLVILMNYDGQIRDLEYDDLTKVDWSNIQLGIGFSSCTIYDKTTNKVITDWDDITIKDSQHTS